MSKEDAMPGAIAVPIRQQMVDLKAQGKSYRDIAQQLQQSRHSVRRICTRYEREQTLVPHTGRCGHRGIHFERLVWRSAIYLKRRHPQWGGGIIRVLLQQRWPERSIPTERTLQRWFRAAGVGTTIEPAPRPRRQRAQQAHQCWQVDAVSHQLYAETQQASWLSATDEASGALLGCSAFPLSQL
jgi:Homeodomain-like domain